MAKTYQQIVLETEPQVRELFPWDLVERCSSNPALLLVDVREPYEFRRMHIAGSINVPRGILESACDWDYEETVPELVTARGRELVLVCRSGNRSVLAARVMNGMGFENVASLKTGLRGWNDYEQPLVDAVGETVALALADDYFLSRVRPEQLDPARRAVRQPSARNPGFTG